MTRGSLCMHMLRDIITAGVNHDDTLVLKYIYVQQNIIGIVSAAVHCFKLIQFDLATNSLVGVRIIKKTEA